MKLASVQISNYKCIRDTCHFDVSDITCLVGMNESGKTSVLEALYRLNPIIPGHGMFNVDDDFPRIDVEDYRLEVRSGKKEPAIVTRAVFTLDEKDCKELEKDYPGVLAGPEMILSKGYENSLTAEIAVHEEVMVHLLLKKSSLPAQLMKDLAKCSTLSDVASSLHGHEGNDSSLQFMTSVGEIQEKGLGAYLFEKYMADKVPRFLYFDEFYQMAGHVNIEGLIQRQKENRLLESDYPLLGLIDLARLDLEEIINPSRALERDNRLEGASNHLTRNVMKYWSQNKFLEMRFDIRPALPNDPEGMQTGTNLWCHVYNSKQKVRTLLGNRSRGFIWFFSFLAWFSQQKQKNIPLILLLDEPALFLHGAAQRDLLRYLEDESKTGHQAVYTTQSPYMVDSLRFDRVRIVEDKGMLERELSPAIRVGTQVYTEVQDVTQESVLPLYGALGNQMHDRLLTGPNVLVVDGIADLLYCATMSSLLKLEDREGLDAKWTVTPLGGARMLAAFVSLVGDTKNKMAGSLVVIRESDIGVLENLIKRDLLQKQKIFFYGNFTGTADSDIEDLFDQDFYVSLVNGEYRDSISRPIKKGHLSGGGVRITSQMAKYFDSISATTKMQFDPSRPARYFAENAASLKEEISKETYGRFEKMFKTFNSCP